MEAKLTYFTSFDGTRIYYEWWMPRKPKAIVLLVHGLGDHCGRYGPFTKFFAKRNIGVCLFDMRGHGRSGGLRGHFGRFQELLSDLSVCVQMISAKYRDVPLYLVGHSFGGLVALNYVVRFPKRLSGLILSSPCIVPRLIIPKWKKSLSEKAHRWMPTLRIEQEISPNALSHEEEVVAAYKEDDLVVHKFSLSVGHEILKHLDLVMALAPRVYLPSLFMHAGDDAICDAGGTKQFFGRISVGCRSFKSFDGYFHELFNEVGSESVFNYMFTWLENELKEERSVKLLSGVELSDADGEKAVHPKRYRDIGEGYAKV